MYNPQLKTFITVADSGSFNKAAELLFVSSTAVIKQMNLLEDNVGVRLFNRSHKGLSLTEAGDVFYKDAKQMIKHSEAMIKRAREAERGVNKVIRIGTSPITPIDYLTSLAPQLQQHDLQFQMVPFENNPENARQILDNLGKDIDMIMGVFDAGTPQYYQKIQTLAVDALPFRIMMSSTHELCAKENLEWSDLDGHRLYLLDAGWSASVNALRQEVEEQYPNIEIVKYSFLDTDVFNQALNDNDLFVGLSIWDKIHPFITSRPMNWDYAMNYGVLYSKEPTKEVERFIEVVKEYI